MRDVRTLDVSHFGMPWPLQKLDVARNQYAGPGQALGRVRPPFRLLLRAFVAAIIGSIEVAS
jgi:hypothetical protein